MAVPDPTMMRTRVVADLTSIGLDSNGWNALASRSATKTVFQTYEWALSWWHVFRDVCEPRFVVACDGEVVTGVAPLVVRRGAFGQRVMRFLGDGRADYCDLLAPRGDTEVVSALLDVALTGPGWDVLELNNVPAASSTVAIVSDYCNRTGRKCIIEDHFVCPTLLIKGHEESALRVLNKPSLRRRQNYFERAGRLSCRHLTDAAEAQPYLDRFFQQHVERWGQGRNGSLFNNPRNRAFYRELTANLGRSGSLLFSVVEFEGSPIAFHYGFDYDGIVTWYKPSFDAAHAGRSPGLVLVRMLIAYAVALQRRELDFTLGDEAFKRRFTNARRTTVRIQVFRKSFRFLVERSRRGIARALRNLRVSASPRRLA